MAGHPFECFDDSITGYTANHGYKGAFSTMPGLIGKYRVNFAIAQAGFIQAQVTTQILFEDNVFFGMIQLIPMPIVANDFLVLFAKGLTIQPVSLSKNTDAYGSAFNLLLLKKQRTLH